MKPIKRVACGVAALAAIAGATIALPATSASALPPGASQAGAVTLSVSGGTSNTAFQIVPPSGAACPGTAAAGYRYQTFIAPSTVDVGTLIWDFSGSPTGTQLVPPSGAPAFDLGGAQTAVPAGTGNLRNSGGTAVKGLSPAIGNQFLAQQAASFQGAAFSTLSPGTYKVGFACTLPVVIGINDNGTPADPSDDFPNTGSFLTTQSFYSFQITVASSTGAGPNNFIWGQPAVPALPAITASAPSASVPVVSYSVPAAIGAVTNLTATVTPTNPAGAALPTINVPVASQAFPNTTGTFSVPGLTLGTVYSVSVTASNQATTAASNLVSVQQINAAVNPGPAATGVDGTDSVTINWLAPLTGPAVSGYRVNISGQAPLSFGPGVLTTGAVSLPNASYTATVTALYPASAFVPGNESAPSNTVTVASKPNTLLYQVITVERPAGALILTQRCGVYGGLPAFGNLPGVTTNAPGVSFPESLAAVGTVGTTVVPATGTAPSLPNGSTGLLPAVANGGLDPQIGQYPNPATPQYPTQCGVAMGTARLVLEGPMAGSFYTADGRMNQVTVLDTRDDDKGWTANGNIPADFATGPVAAPTSTFSGNFLGWQPIRTRMTTRPDYLRAGVIAGPIVVPGAGSPGTAGPGLKNNPVLAEAPANQGLGIVDLDARLALLIPATADRGVYTGRLDLTVVSR